MTTPPTHQSAGSHHLVVALGLAALGWLAMAVQEVLLFLRPNPYGPGLPFLILFVVSLVLWWTGQRVIRSKPMALSLPRPVGMVMVAVPLLIPLLIDHYRSPGRARRNRVRPEVMTLYVEAQRGFTKGDRPRDFGTLAREYQAAWFRQSGDTAWRFTDPERPLVRVPLTSPTPVDGRPWNVIFI